MRKRHRLISITFVILFVLVWHGVALAANRQEIMERWELLKPKYNAPIFITEPSVTAPYTPGQLSEEFIQDGINSINFVRFMVGLPDDVEIKASLSEESQHGAVLMAAAGYRSHQPSKPDDMDQKFYDQGLANTSSSNIITTRQGSLASQVYWYINDNDRKNVVRVGHRRWILNPPLKYASFGAATVGTRIYGTLAIFDESRKDVKLPKMILCPNSGDWPSGYMRNNMPWSVQLNSSYYLTPKLNEVRVKVTRVSDGRVWELSRQDNTSPPMWRYFNIDTSYCGNEKFHTAIIFRPDDIQSFIGEYQVSISGIRLASGAKTTLDYSVNFFDMDIDLNLVKRFQ